MDAYVYNADLYCADCGRDIIANLRELGGKPDPDGDSEQWPQGTYSNGGGESDTPCHCGAGAECLNAIEVDGHWVGAFLENPLTDEGREYVKSKAREELTELVKLWCEFYDIDAFAYSGPVTFSGKFGGQDVKGDVVNPGECFGRTWLIYVEDCFDQPLFVVEADDPCEAEEAFLADSDLASMVRIDEVDLPDFDPEELHYDSDGNPVNTESIQIHGPFACRYHAKGLPDTGVDPLTFDRYEEK
jgi:hypothetical protein